MEGGDPNRDRKTYKNAHWYSVNEILSILSKCKYRASIQYLRNHKYASVNDLAEYVNEHCPHSRGIYQETVHLQHSVLPKLDQCGLVDYDDRDYIVRDQTPEVIGEALTFIAELEKRLNE